MRVLSLSRPWPWIMLHPDPAIVKLVENRTWKPPTGTLCQWIALHSANSWDPNALPYWESLGITGFPSHKEAYPSGVIEGLFFPVKVLSGSRENLPPELPRTQARWFFGPFGWVASRSVRLTTPIVHKGGQGLRHLPDDKVADIVSQVTKIGVVP